MLNKQFLADVVEFACEFGVFLVLSTLIFLFVGGIITTILLLLAQK